jgi:cholest-4-en-3-one 26-monooxygenase
MELADIDLLDLDEFARRTPHDWFTYLRRHAPVYRHPEPVGPGFWVLSRYDDVNMVERDAATFSSAIERGGVVDLADPTPGEHRSVAEGLFEEGGRMMFMMDPPGHTVYRNAMQAEFRRLAIRRLEDELRDRAARVIDHAIARGSFDFVPDIALEFPAQVITSLLGLPMEDRYTLAGWSDRMSEDPEYATDETRREAERDVIDYATRLADSRAADPGGGLVATLVQAEIGGERISRPDFILYFQLLALAGEVTTRSALSQGMLAFLEHPDQWDVLVEDPSVIDTAVEEVFRWGTPALYFRRTATMDVEIRDVRIAAGDKVSIWYVSANRDEEVFPDPFRFDVKRWPNEHITFGGGRHFCLGVHLARLELKVLFSELAARAPRIELAGGVSRLRSNLEHGLKRLPVRVAERRRAG